ncbi:MAG: proline dehydrogenase, partial [Acidobacteria bacterium]|nr:proline dehydrogenase [Acidobacteriota bacterium]NIQ84330.1 proline dehydrogenase [Acidobacteriota bacterium]
TQLGMDIDEAFCEQNLRSIVSHAERLGNFVRIDMESSAYTERTLRIFRRVFADHRNVGVVIQSYLKRSERDVN